MDIEHRRREASLCKLGQEHTWVRRLKGWRDGHDFDRPSANLGFVLPLSANQRVGAENHEVRVSRAYLDGVDVFRSCSSMVICNLERHEGGFWFVRLHVGWLKIVQ